VESESSRGDVGRPRIREALELAVLDEGHPDPVSAPRPVDTRAKIGGEGVGLSGGDRSGSLVIAATGGHRGALFPDRRRAPLPELELARGVVAGLRDVAADHFGAAGGAVAEHPFPDPVVTRSRAARGATPRAY
jgi:hypothetical protein